MINLRHILLASILIATPTMLSAGERSPARAIVGNTVHGADSDGEFYDYYAPNGAVTSKLVSGDVSHGRWTIENGNMCLDFPNDTKACYRIDLAGGNVTMTDVSSGETFNNRLLRGNPQRL